MLRPALLLALAVLISTPVQAGEVSRTTPIFGQKSCKPVFPCAALRSSDTKYAMQEKILGIADACVGKGFGMSQTGGYFEKSFGLDSSLCLTTKKLARAEMGATMTPKCCVQPVADQKDTCQVKCTMYAIK